MDPRSYQKSVPYPVHDPIKSYLMANFIFVFPKVARESYLQWLADQEKTRKSGSGRHPPPAATVTSGQVSPRAVSSPTCSAATFSPGHVSPRGSVSPRTRPGTAGNSPKAGCSYHQVLTGILKLGNGIII